MSIAVSHKFHSAKADSSDATLINPSNWNDTHTVTNNSKWVDCKDYVWQQTPGGSLTSGIANSITLTPVPVGVNGSDVGHYVLLSNGVGAAEAVLIAGGTAVSGAASGTIIVVPASSHSGAWTVAHANNGLQEAINATSNSVVNAFDAIVFYGPVTILNNVTVNSSLAVAHTWAGATGASVFIIKSDRVVLQNFNILLGTAYNFVTVGGTYANLRILNNIVAGGVEPILISAGTYIEVAGNRVSGFTTHGIFLATSVNIKYSNIHDNYVDTAGCTATDAVGIGCWGSHTRICENFITIDGTPDTQAITWINNPAAGLVDGVISNNIILINGTQAFEGIGVASCSDFTITGNSIYFNAVVTRPGFYGIELNQCNNGTVVGNAIYGNKSGSASAFIALFTTSNCLVANNLVVDWAIDATSAGILLLLTDTSGLNPETLSFNMVQDNLLIMSDNTAAGQAIRIDTLHAGTATFNVFKGNMIYGSLAASFTGIAIANSVSTTFTNALVKDNVIDHCYLAMSAYLTVDTWFINNRITGSTTKLTDLGTTSKYIALADTVITTVASATSIAASDTYNVFLISGTTTITTITGGWLGRRLRLIKTDAGSVTVGGGGNVPGSHTLAQYGGLDLVNDGTNWY